MFWVRKPSDFHSTPCADVLLSFNVQFEYRSNAYSVRVYDVTSTACSPRTRVRTSEFSFRPGQVRLGNPSWLAPGRSLIVKTFVLNVSYCAVAVRPRCMCDIVITRNDAFTGVYGRMDGGEKKTL